MLLSGYQCINITGRNNYSRGTAPPSLDGTTICVQDLQFFLRVSNHVSYIKRIRPHIKSFYRRSDSDTQLCDIENGSRLLKSNPVSVPQTNISRQNTPVFIECGSNSMYNQFIPVLIYFLFYFIFKNSL